MLDATSYTWARFNLTRFRHDFFTYNRIHFLCFCAMALVGAVVIYLIEEQRVPFVDALYTAVSAVCVTGLITLDTHALRPGSQAVIFVLLFGGGNILWSTVPVLIRRRFFRKTMTRELAQFGLNPTLRDAALSKEVEYRALGWILRIAYFHLLFWPLLTFVLTGAYLWQHSLGGVLRAQNVNIWLFAFFMPFSAVNNAGFSLMADNVMSFAGKDILLVPLSGLVLLGNVLYPVVMYGSVWLLDAVYQKQNGQGNTALAFLLARPRKCFTHMFNKKATLVLVASLLLFTMFEFFVFLGYEFSSSMLAFLSPRERLLSGWFQSASTRTAGFNVVDLSLVAPAMQLIYAILMYLTVYPYAMTIRHTKDMDRAFERSGFVPESRRSDVALAQKAAANGGSHLALVTTDEAEYLEEDMASSAHTFRGNRSRSFNSLGNVITPPSMSNMADTVAPAGAVDRIMGHITPTDSLRSAIRHTFTTDLTLLTAAVILIVMVESHKLETTVAPRQFSIFGIIFELCSAYGTVGLSLGFPNSVLSLSGQFSVVSKLVVMAVMMGGRHRGLPVGIDPAVYLPSLLGTHSSADNKARVLTAVDAAQETQEQQVSVPPLHVPKIVLTETPDLEHDEPPLTLVVRSVKQPGSVVRPGTIIRTRV